MYQWLLNNEDAKTVVTNIRAAHGFEKADAELTALLGAQPPQGHRIHEFQMAGVERHGNANFLSFRRSSRPVRAQVIFHVTGGIAIRRGSRRLLPLGPLLRPQQFPQRLVQLQRSLFLGR